MLSTWRLYILCLYFHTIVILDLLNTKVVAIVFEPAIFSQLVTL